MRRGPQAHPTPAVALTIAGTDSGGGAGIAADLLSFAAHGVFGTLVVTAVTAQNTRGVSVVAPERPEVVDAQIAAVLEDFPVIAVKTGMLANAEIVEVVTARAERGDLPLLVVDPVMVAASGGSLLTSAGRRAYRRLLSSCALVTPNVAEAEALCDVSISDLGGLADAARTLVDLGARAALVTGGHLVAPEAVDVFYDGEDLRYFSAPRIASANIHGTGCTLSAAITALLARGSALEEAINGAKAYVTGAIASAANWELGSGPGPLDHLNRLAASEASPEASLQRASMREGAP